MTAKQRVDSPCPPCPPSSPSSPSRPSRPSSPSSLRWSGPARASPCRGAQHVGCVRIGTSGWRYPPWRGVFYPRGLPQRAELAYAASRMGTVEINGSFYSLQRPSSYLAWYACTPDDFVFSVKGGSFITHNKKLRDCRQPLANFFASGVLALDDKLGPILWQLPPQLGFDAERLEAFFELLPRTTHDAAALAGEHDARVKHGAFLDVKRSRALRYAIEARHESFLDAAFIRLLRKHGVALCVADTARRWPYCEDVTADFMYVRLHGGTELYVSGYHSLSLDAWAWRIEQWRRGRQPPEATLADPRGRAPRAAARDVFVYFDNDARARAPFDAMNLAARLGIGQRVPFPLRARRAAEAVRGVEMPRARAPFGRR